jgi:hypothetical protein
LWSLVVGLGQIHDSLQAKERGGEIDGIPEGSVGLQMERAEMKYEDSETRLRTDVANLNQYTLILRRQPHSAWYRKNANELMRGNGHAICRKCWSYSVV